MVAYHESGHALVAYKLDDFDPLFKITIVSRGMAGGYTLALPEEDRHINTKAYLEKRLAMMLGRPRGRRDGLRRDVHRPQRRHQPR